MICTVFVFLNNLVKLNCSWYKADICTFVFGVCNTCTFEYMHIQTQLGIPLVMCFPALYVYIYLAVSEI